MTWPKTSIIWLNHNSTRIIPIVLESLESIVNLDYPSDRYELIVVDNGSTDGSFEKIKELLERKNSLRKKIIKLDHNLGFTGGNNIGFTMRDKESKYVLLLNNDAVLFQDGLKTLVEYAENYDTVAGLQGVVLTYKSRHIDTAGGYISELLQSHVLGQGQEYPWILKKPVYVTYADGSCVLYRVESIVRSLGNKLFVEEFFGYGDDNVLGLMMWNHGYKLIAIPEAVANHARGLTFGKGKRSALAVYLGERNRIALSLITNTRYKHIISLHTLRNTVTTILTTRFKSSTLAMARALFDGIKLGRKLKSRGILIDIYRAPIIKIPIKDLGVFFTTKRAVTEYFKDWALKNLNSLFVE
jgi:GT2 family glycosyltransferase